MPQKAHLAGRQEERCRTVGTAERGAQSADLDGIAQWRACAMHCDCYHMPRVDSGAGQGGPYHRLQAW